MFFSFVVCRKKTLVEDKKFFVKRAWASAVVGNLLLKVFWSSRAWNKGDFHIFIFTQLPAVLWDEKSEKVFQYTTCVYEVVSLRLI